MSKIDERIKSTIVIVLSSVINPLCGYKGTFCIHDIQKGALPENLKKLNHLLSVYEDIVEQYLNKKPINKLGSGTAGQFGTGSIAFYKTNYFRGTLRKELLRLQANLM